MAETKRRGRKAQTAGPGERVSLGLKVTPETKNKLDKAAKANGRTQSQEAEARIFTFQCPACSYSAFRPSACLCLYPPV